MTRREEKVSQAETDSLVVGADKFDDPVRRVRPAVQVVEIDQVEPRIGDAVAAAR